MKKFYYLIYHMMNLDFLWNHLVKNAIILHSSSVIRQTGLQSCSTASPLCVFYYQAPLWDFHCKAHLSIIEACIISLGPTHPTVGKKNGVWSIWRTLARKHYLPKGQPGKNGAQLGMTVGLRLNLDLSDLIQIRGFVFNPMRSGGS